MEKGFVPKAVTFQACMAEVCDPCSLGLDFLKISGFPLNLSSRVMMLPWEQFVSQTSSSQ